MLRPLYLQPDLEARVQNYSLSERSMLLDFARRGYIVIDLELPDDFTQQIVRDLEPEYGRKWSFLSGLTRVQDAPIDSVKTLACNAQVLKVLELLHGRKPFPFQTLNFNRGTEQATHSDTIHFDSSPPGFMAGVWVALEDVHPGNGPLHYYPGSHKLPHLTLSDFGSRSGRRYYESHYVPGIARVVNDNGLQKEEAYLRRGQALIWSANLLHGGSPIKDQASTRHSQVTHYYFDDCAYLTPLASDPLLGRVFVRSPRDIRTGQVVHSVYHGRRLRGWRDGVGRMVEAVLRRIQAPGRKARPGKPG